MWESWKKKFDSLKLNIKFTLITIVLVAIPIAAFVAVLSNNMEESAIHENQSYMQYTMERNQENIRKNIDSVNMITQFFLGDTALLDILDYSVGGEEMTTEELLQFYNSDIASLERLVNSNTLLHGVRVYAGNDEIQEMVPILYNHSRMKRQEWSERESFAGWNFNYHDALFTSKMSETKMAALITPVTNYERGQIGVIEAVVTMEKMFPTLYENIENEWSCFISDEGSLYFGDNKQENSEEFVMRELEEREESTDREKITTCYKERGGDHFIVSMVHIREIGGTLMAVQDITEKVRSVYRMRNFFIFAIILLMIGLGYLIHFIVRRLFRQFYQILGSIRKVQKGDLGVRIDNGSSDEMGELGTQINKMLDSIEALTRESIDREILIKNSEIRALQNQINAHFIYNVLESIKMMAEIDEKYEISDALTSLGMLLRYSMRWVSGNVRVEEEIEYIKNYLALLNLRFDYEIYLSLNMPPELMKQEIPKMSLQPIIENAIYHGIEELAEDTSIYMKGYAEGTDCLIEITDAGRGMSEEEVEELKKKIAGEIETSGGSGNGIGLKNVQDRIHISFGERYGIEINSKLGCYTKITVRIPLQEKLLEEWRSQ